PPVVPRGGRRTRCGPTRPAPRMIAGRPPRSLPSARPTAGACRRTRLGGRGGTPRARRARRSAAGTPGRRPRTGSSHHRQAPGPGRLAGLVGEHELLVAEVLTGRGRTG